MITLISSPKQLMATNMTTTVHKFQEKGTTPPKKPRKAILLEELPDNSNIQLAKNEKGLFVDDSGFIHVYTDGACSKNGQLGKMVKKSFVSFYLRCKTTTTYLMKPDLNTIRGYRWLWYLVGKRP